MHSAADDSAYDHEAMLGDEPSAEFLAALRGIGPNRAPANAAARSSVPDTATVENTPATLATPVVVPASTHSVTTMEEQLRQIASVMSDDLEEIRQKILAERKDVGPGSDLTAEEERRAYAELKVKHQVDLNDEHHLADLEDKGLMSHMERAREILAAQEKSRAELPSRESVKANHVKNLRQFSALVQALRTADMELQSGVEETFLQARNAARIGNGETPHSFPKVPEAKPANHEALTLLSSKIDKTANSCQESSKAITSAIQTLDVLRRESEAVVDAMTKMADHYRAAYNALEQLLLSSNAGK